ncbi:MAG: Maf family protein [Candidatus Omnitrophica bacterium]|nr:Maf family protein [Candidatus Omnitrophota bacterium]
MLNTNRKIVLASASPQRARLLKQLGLKFTVCPGNIKESRKIKTTCAELVKENALKKARAVAKRFKQGIIIGVDTVVFVEGKVIGKPKNILEARKTLKLITENTNWVYSGIAVIDIDINKTYAASEKTKVIFRKLSKDEFESLLREEVRFDRAGGVDIEGKTKIFVKEIKGDFYNVVGLPVDKFKHLLSQVQ